ncbi:uncharacterized protein LOC117818237 [Notolabrus celidotus]|uniref:uncharacterized protein LOC117818237 n=1 Tax=Notolabrus celidotus TaxID=1203425 RepID=UPI00148FC195|nr:uncharacterized protein LOC117818237 [Notolabrus celidotus]
MKLNSFSVFSLSLLLLCTHFSLAKKGGGGGFGRSGSSGRSGNSKTSWFSKGNSQSKTNTGQKTNQGPNTQGRNPKQPAQPNPGNYPRQSPAGGPHNQNPMRGSTHGGYQGGYMNYNPNNKVLSPRFGGSYGYGGRGSWGGSPFSQSVQQMGMYPNDRSRGFGRTAVVAAAGGAMAGMALGYGLGRFPRPYFPFRSPHDEYSYNHYMYRRYGTRSTDTNDYSRDYEYKPPQDSYNIYMKSCMQRTDLLPAENPKPNNKQAAMTPGTGKVSNGTETMDTATESSSTSAPSFQRPMNLDETNPEDDDDTVSIMEIGYPELMEQIKARRCLELYMEHSEKYLQVRNTAGGQGLEMGWRVFLAVFTSTILVLLSSNMQMH